MSTITDEIYSAIQLFNGCNRADINEAVGDQYDAKQISNALSRLADAGRIERVEGYYYIKPDATQPTPTAVTIAPAPVTPKATDPVQQLTTAVTELKTLQADEAERTELNTAPSNQPENPMTDLIHENQSLYRLLADIREAASDPEGRMMQDELVEHIRETFIYAGDLEEKYRMLCRHLGIGYSYTPDELKQLLDAKPATPTELTIRHAIIRLQEELGSLHDDDATIGISSDQAVIRSMNRKFDLPSDSDELQQFIESLSWVTGQWIEDKAA